MAQPAAEQMTLDLFEECKQEFEFVRKREKKECDSCLLWHKKTELAVNYAIQLEYSLMTAFHAMRSYCNQDRVALKGLACHLQHEMERQYGCALTWSDYQTQRGGCTRLFPLSSPKHDYGSTPEGDALCVMEKKLALERLKYVKLNDMHKIADEVHDHHMQDLLEETMSVQQCIIKRDADWVNQLRRVGKGLGEWNFDHHLLTALAGKHAMLRPGVITPEEVLKAADIKP